MGGFFHGWRRKTSVMTLLLALVLVGGWFRSLVICDWICFRSSKERVHTFSSNSSELIWIRRGGDATPNLYGTMEPGRDLLNQITIEHHWSLCGFHVVKGVVDGIDVPIAFWTIPYWPVVLSLTLFSAYLLFEKPGLTIPKIVSEHPIPDETGQSFTPGQQRSPLR